MAITTPDTHTIDQLEAIKKSVNIFTRSSEKFVVVQNSNVKFINSLVELNYWITKNGLTIDRFVSIFLDIIRLGIHNISSKL